MTRPSLVARPGPSGIELAAAGAWTVAHARNLDGLIETTVRTTPADQPVTIDMHSVTALDTYGAWLIERLVRAREAGAGRAHLEGLPDRYRALYEEIQSTEREPTPPPPKRPSVLGYVTQLGEATVRFFHEFGAFAAMLGAVVLSLGRALTNPRSFRFTPTMHHLDRVGWQAVPIMLLITFLIGCIIAQQGFFHFRKFGADAYVVDMVGILVLREIGVLIVAIMMAGRSGSAYTAELGSMKMREEIDALRTMGRDPVDVLILPRIIALVIALPILTFLGSMAALYGGGLVAWAYGGMSPAIYIERLREAVSLTHFEVGMIKAPFMALVIGIVACTQGLAVKGSAESLGRETTASVVKSIFLVIVLDGLFAIFFASIDM
ncbi:MlaE family lipid ABC transporter permease subunit [Hyphomicrobium sp.]|uniref:ABC transporter permease n=1 Tax=Hyphomicrobium sp. TaxID=82 RepID=UPI0025B8A86A|nr:MlaE family lipid ABC transporter permease subunit [Hyphomicrobium sp.]MCC7251371.1 MlaE family lipid ABC transporter permease subunit [Hyphomicrobium sp.]